MRLSQQLGLLALGAVVVIVAMGASTFSALHG